MLTRRTFLAGIPLSVFSLNTIAKPASVKLGCQTNAWRINPANFSDLLNVLAKLKELGFDGFETGFRNLQPQFGNIPQAARKSKSTDCNFSAAIFFSISTTNKQILLRWN